MGLDVTAFCRVQKVSDNDSDDEPRRIRLVMNPSFPGRDAGLDGDGIYSYMDAVDVLSRPYGAYNRWRETLAKLAGYPLTRRIDDDRASHAAGCWDATSGPFYELIDFSDCEGSIGPVAAAKLAQDFAEWDERAKALSSDFYSVYTKFRAGCDLAADGGAILFS